MFFDLIPYWRSGKNLEKVQNFFHFFICCKRNESDSYMMSSSYKRISRGTDFAPITYLLGGRPNFEEPPGEMRGRRKLFMDCKNSLDKMMGFVKNSAIQLVFVKPSKPIKPLPFWMEEMMRRKAQKVVPQSPREIFIFPGFLGSSEKRKITRPVEIEAIALSDRSA